MLPFLSLFLPPQSRATQGREQRQLSPTELDSNTRAGVQIPSLRNSPCRREKGSHCRSPGHDCNEDKKATKRLHFKSMKSTRSCCAQARDTVQGSSGRGSVAHSVLASPLMQGVGASQPQEQLQEHREGSQGPWGQGVPGSFVLLTPVHHIPAVTAQPELSMFQGNTIPGRFSWLQIHRDNECTDSTNGKGLQMLLKKK